MPIPGTDSVDTFRFAVGAPYRPHGIVTLKAGWTGNTVVYGRALMFGGYKAGRHASYVNSLPGLDAGAAGNVIVTAVSQDFLAQQTISGNASLTVWVSESVGTLDLFLRVYIWVLTAGTADTSRGTLLDFTDTLSEFPTVGAGVSTGAQALSSLDVEDGDRIVVEIGCVRNGATTTGQARIILSGASLGSSFTDDLTIGDTDEDHGTTLFFDSPLTLLRPTPEEGDILAGNQNLTLYNAATGLAERIVETPGFVTTFGDDHVVSPSGGVRLSDGSIVLGADAGLQYEPTWLWKYNSDLTFDSFLPIGTGINPHSLAITPDDVIYVGFVGDDGTGCGEGGDTGSPSSASFAIQRLTSGVIDATYTVDPDLGASQAIDLESNGTIVRYTSLGRKIKRFSFTDGQLEDFAQLPAATSGEVARGMRILRDGGVIVADGLDIKRLDDFGSVTQIYDIPATQPAVFISDQTYAGYLALLATYSGYVDWGVVSLDPDGDGFWAANRSAYPTSFYGTMAHFSLNGSCDAIVTSPYVAATGGAFCSGGITVYGEWRAIDHPEESIPIDDSIPCCASGCECHPTTGTGTTPGSNSPGDTTTPGSTGPILPPEFVEPDLLDDAYWLAACEGGGLVPMAADPVDVEMWAH